MIVYLVLAVAAIYAALKYVYSYWARKGFAYIEPSLITGNMGSIVKREASFGMAVYNLYKMSTEPIVGIYLFFRPALLIRDAELAKRILTTDFSSFHDRGVHSNEGTNPVSANLFSLPGEKWKNLRNRLSPTFTSGKLKNMFLTFEDVGNAMLEHLQETIPQQGKIIDLRDLTTMYATDVIASSFFGLQVNTFKEPKNSFQNIRNLLDQSSFLGRLATATTFLCPKLFDILHLHVINKPVNDALVKLIGETIKYREENNIERKDFMQMLIQLRNTGVVKEDGDWATGKTNGGQISMTIEQCAAQAFLFYFAGLETTAATTAFCIYEIAKNENIKKNVLEDIKKALNNHNGEVAYESIQDMKYLEQCILETVRLYPGLLVLNRECTKRYYVPGSKTVIEEGTPIVLSVMGLQRDPNYFPEPEKFKPERFAEGERDYVDAAYMPFGEGPRICIGLRQGKLSAKVAIVKILTSFHVNVADDKEIEFEPFAVSLIAKQGPNMYFRRIESESHYE